MVQIRKSDLEALHFDRTHFDAIGWFAIIENCGSLRDPDGNFMIRLFMWRRCRRSAGKFGELLSVVDPERVIFMID